MSSSSSSSSKQSLIPRPKAKLPAKQQPRSLSKWQSGSPSEWQPGSPSKQPILPQTPPLAPPNGGQRPGSTPGPASSVISVRKRRSAVSAESSSRTVETRQASSQVPPPVPTPAPVPVPHEDSKIYSNTRLQESLKFASQALEHRDISPRTERIYRRFQVEINAALLATSNEERLKKIACVVAFEKLIANTYNFQPENFGHGADVRADLLTLRQMQYLARYGDCVKIVVNNERIEELSSRHRWTELSATLKEEGYNLMKVMKDPYGSSTKHYSFPMLHAIKLACNAMGYDMNLVKYSIHLYVQRNLSFHRDLEDLVAQGDFPVLANMLYRDLRDLRCVFSSFTSGTDILSLSGIMTRLIKALFDTSVDMDYPNAWIATPELVNVYRKANQKTPGQSNVFAEVIEAAAKKEEQ